MMMMMTAPSLRRAPISALQATLDRLGQLHPKAIDLSLGRIERLLDRLDRPQDRLPPCVHVAGTNGKGSVVALVRAMAEAAGRSCHVYTSPHLVRFNERIVLAGVEIDDAALVALLKRIEVANAGDAITFFEITTAAALLAFSETPADLALIEVGLGGRFDATNVIPAPACSVVTPVGLDHKEFLGEDLAKIAWEKAGILRAGTPTVVAAQDPEARAAIVAEAQHVGADLQIWGSDFRAFPDAGRLAVEFADEVYDLPAPALVGAHQVINAGVAAAVARVLGLPATAIGDGVARAVWPGRMQRVIDGPLADAARASGAEVWLDGAHNAMAARALAVTLADMDDAAPRPLIIAVGLQRNKDAEGFLRAFAGLASGVVALPLSSGAVFWPTETLAHMAAELLDAPAATIEDLSHTVDAARVLVADGSAPRIVVCGSLHLIGEALSLGRGLGPKATPG